MSGIWNSGWREGVPQRRRRIERDPPPRALIRIPHPPDPLSRRAASKHGSFGLQPGVLGLFSVL